MDHHPSEAGGDGTGVIPMYRVPIPGGGCIANEIGAGSGTRRWQCTNHASGGTALIHVSRFDHRGWSVAGRADHERRASLHYLISAGVTSFQTEYDEGGAASSANPVDGTGDEQVLLHRQRPMPGEGLIAVNDRADEAIVLQQLGSHHEEKSRGEPGRSCLCPAFGIVTGHGNELRDLLVTNAIWPVGKDLPFQLFDHAVSVSLDAPCAGGTT